MDRQLCEDTRLLYCTTGVLLQKLINDKNMHRFTHVILDEVSDSSLNVKVVSLPSFCRNVLIVKPVTVTGWPFT